MPYQGRESRPEELAPVFAVPGYVLVPPTILQRSFDLLGAIGCSPEGADADIADAAKLKADILPLITAAPGPEEYDMADDDGCPVCGADGGTSCGMPNCGLMSAAPAVQSAARTIAAEQSYDTGLWFVATTVSEAHLQAALRRLAAAVEGEAPAALTPLHEGRIRQLADGHLKYQIEGPDVSGVLDFARAIEQAHGIGEKT
jgi:hypothetical protein